MLRSRSLLPKLSASTTGKGLVLFLDQLVLLENAQLGPSLAWLSVQWGVCGFLRYYWGDVLMKPQTIGWNHRLSHCGRRGFFFSSQTRNWNCLGPLSVQLELLG